MCSSAWIPHCGAKSSSHPCRGGSHCGFPGSWWTLPHPSPTSPHQLHTGPEQTQGSQYLMITLMNSQSQDNSVSHLEFVGEIYWSSTLIFKRAHYFFFFFNTFRVKYTQSYLSPPQTYLCILLHQICVSHSRLISGPLKPSNQHMVNTLCFWRTDLSEQFGEFTWSKTTSIFLKCPEVSPMTSSSMSEPYAVEKWTEISREMLDIIQKHASDLQYHLCTLPPAHVSACCFLKPGLQWGISHWFQLPWMEKNTGNETITVEEECIFRLDAQ